MRLSNIFVGAIFVISGIVHAQTSAPTTLVFETHAAYFSREVALPVVLDPQVFVLDKSAQAERHWQGIDHIAGVRNARVDDRAESEIYTATGLPIGMTLGQWLSAGGSVTLTQRADGGENITVVLHGLRPGGQFSLFENHFDQNPTGFTPLDGTGIGNSFVANSDGAASVIVTAPSLMTHANAVLVVYHSDNAAHGSERGVIGKTAHHQLIARLP